MQHALSVVAFRLAQVPDFAVGLVHQDERFRIERGHLIHHAGSSVPARSGRVVAGCAMSIHSHMITV